MDYATFLGVVKNEHLSLLMSIAANQRISSANNAQNDANFLALQDMFNAGVITTGSRTWENVGGTTYQHFEATITQECLAHLTRMLMERIAIDRVPR